MRSTLVIDIGRERLRMGLFAPGADPGHEFSERPLPPGPEGLNLALAAMLEALRGVKGLDSVRVLVSIPAEDLSIRIVEMPFSDRRKVIEALPFELAGLLHAEMDEFVTDAVPLGHGRFLAVAAEKRLVAGYLETLRSLGLDPCWLGSALFAMPSLISELYGVEGVKALVFPGALTVVEGGEPRLFKPVVSIEGARLGAAFLDAEGLAIDEVYYSGWKEADIRDIFHGAALMPMSLPGAFPSEGASVYALALMDRTGVLAESVNFRRGEFEYTREKTAFKKGLAWAAALVGFIALLGAVDLYVRYLGLSAQANYYRGAVEASYQGLFPGEKRPVDPVYELETRLKAMDKEAGALGAAAPGPLDALRKIARAAPEASGIRITAFELSSDGRVAASGEAATFEAASALRDALALSGLRDVTLGESRATAGGGASFTINAYLR